MQDNWPDFLWEVYIGNLIALPAVLGVTRTVRTAIEEFTLRHWIGWSRDAKDVLLTGVSRVLLVVLAEAAILAYLLIEHELGYAVVIASIALYFIVAKIGVVRCRECKELIPRSADPCPSCGAYVTAGYAAIRKSSRTCLLKTVSRYSVYALLGSFVIWLVTLTWNREPARAICWVALFGAIGALLGALKGTQCRLTCPKCGMYMGLPENVETSPPRQRRRASVPERRVPEEWLESYYYCPRCDEEFPND